MTPKLNRILDMLDAERIAELIGNKHAMADRSFHIDSNTVSGHPEFAATTTRCVIHCYEHTIAPGATIPEEMASHEARNILDHVYREHGGYEGAYQNARTGKAGGMSGVLNAISRAMQDRQEQQYIEHVFYTEVDPMNYDEIVELMRQYLDRFGSYLSPSERARSPHDLARNYDVIIKSHARAMSAIRSMIKKV